MMEPIALLVAATLSAGTPLALAALGLLVNERAGVVNLGAEGIMLVAAVAGFATAFHSGSTSLGIAAGALAGALLAAVLGGLVIWLNTHQGASGLALSLFGVGFSAFVGLGFVGKSLPPAPPLVLPVLSDLPWLGPALSRWSTSPSRSPCCWRGSWIARAPGSCCVRSASRPSRRTRSATRCAASAWPR
jgi:simple sugar transport system permease protein